MLRAVCGFAFLICFSEVLANKKKPVPVSENGCEESVLRDLSGVTRFFSPIEGLKSMKDLVGFSGNSAADVFSRFMQIQLGESWREQTRSLRNEPHQKEWDELIALYSQNLKPEDAKALLFLFIERIGVENTIKVLAQSPFYLRFVSQESPFEHIRETIAFYDSYMGPEKTTKRLKKSLAGFTAGHPKRLRELTEYLESAYASKALTIKVMESDLHEYSRTKRADIEPIMNLLTETGGLETVLEMTDTEALDSLKPDSSGYLSLKKLKVLWEIVGMTVDVRSPYGNKNVPEEFRDGLRVLVEFPLRSLRGIRDGVQALVRTYGREFVARLLKNNLKHLAWFWSNQTSWLLRLFSYNLIQRVTLLKKHYLEEESLFDFVRGSPGILGDGQAIEQWEQIILDKKRKAGEQLTEADHKRLRETVLAMLNKGHSILNIPRLTGRSAREVQDSLKEGL